MLKRLRQVWRNFWLMVGWGPDWREASKPPPPPPPPPKVDPTASLPDVMRFAVQQETSLVKTVDQILSLVAEAGAKTSTVEYSSSGASFWVWLEWSREGKNEKATFQILFGEEALGLVDRYSSSGPWTQPNPRLYAFCLRMFPNIPNPVFGSSMRLPSMYDVALYRVNGVPVAIMIH